MIDYLILRLETYPQDGGTRPDGPIQQATRLAGGTLTSKRSERRRYSTCVSKATVWICPPRLNCKKIR